MPEPAPRANPGVEPTTQAIANTVARRRRMIVFLVLFCLTSTTDKVMLQQEHIFSGLR
jgi:hypothetical protein